SIFFASSLTAPPPTHSFPLSLHDALPISHIFAKSVALERLLSDRHERLGRGPVFFSSKQVPLDQATSPHRQLPMFTDEAEDACEDRKSTRLNSSHVAISYAVFCLKKKKQR